MPERMQAASNLLKRVTPEKIVRPPGFYTSIALDALTVLSAILFGLFYRGYLRSDISVAWAWIFSALFALFAVFGMLLTKNFSRRLVILSLAILGIAVFFYDVPVLLLAGASATALGLLIWGEMLSRAELQNALTIKFFKVVRPQLSKLITALVILVVFLYLPQWNAAGNLISSSAFDRLYRFFSRATMLLYPELELGSSAGAFAESFAEFRLKTNPAFLQLLPAAKERAVAEAAKQILTGLGNWAGTEISPATPLSSLFYETTLKNLQGWQKKFGSQLMFVWGMIMFFVLRWIGGIARLLLASIAFFVYQSLLAVNFIKIVGENRMHETLEYS